MITVLLATRTVSAAETVARELGAGFVSAAVTVATRIHVPSVSGID